MVQRVTVIHSDGLLHYGSRLENREFSQDCRALIESVISVLHVFTSSPLIHFPFTCVTLAIAYTSFVSLPLHSPSACAQLSRSGFVQYLQRPHEEAQIHDVPAVSRSPPRIPQHG